MKTIGLIGGMSWESTAIYYRLLNELARHRLGRLHSAKLLLWSFDFAEIEALQAKGDWDGATQMMMDAGRSLARGGADFLVICTNTMHMMAEAVAEASGLKVLHIADATAEAMRSKGLSKPILLATRYTMEQNFYKGRLLSRHGIEAVIPDEPGRTVIHDIIYHELCMGMVTDSSRSKYLKVIRTCCEHHEVDSVIMGCTEIGMLLSQQDLDEADLPLIALDTTGLHAEAALDLAIGDP